MQIPAGRRRPVLPSVLPARLAIKPEAAALLVLQPEIVARRRAGLVAPPFRGDALRPLGAGDAMAAALALEPAGRPAGLDRLGLDRLRPRQQPERPRRR